MNTVLIILSIIIIMATLSSVIFFVLVDEDWGAWAGLISLIIVLICSVVVYNIKRPESTEKTEPIVVYTKQPPQIDTIITITNNVADTTYIYHLMKEDK